MKLKDLRALAKRAGYKIQVKTCNLEDLTRNSRKSIKVIPSFPTFFFSETERVNYIASLNEAEKELFFLDIGKIEKELNIK
jgi:hypothetical protein